MVTIMKKNEKTIKIRMKESLFVQMVINIKENEKIVHGVEKENALI